MSRALHRLTARQIQTLREPGRHADGGGLYLRVTPPEGRSWLFMGAIGGKRVELGLGSTSALTLANARALAGRIREAIAQGEDPRKLLKPEPIEPVAGPPTFAAFAESYITSVEAGWKNPIHRQQWRSSIRDHAAALKDVPVDEVATDQVLAVLRPIWTTKPETASRLRGRIEKILDAAKALGHRPRDSINPAALRGHLALLLPKQPKLIRGHHAALPYAEAPAFFADLRERPALSARCLEFTILTAARSGEALGAQWEEIDLAARLWTVPGARMKTGVEHVVPLSSGAVELLERLQPDVKLRRGPVFAVRGSIRSNMAMAMLLKRMGTDVTVHGFRSTFRDWAGDETPYPRELIEQALAHTISNKAERAYRRGTAIERRRELMEAWATFLTSAGAT